MSNFKVAEKNNNAVLGLVSSVKIHYVGVVKISQYVQITVLTAD